MEKKILEKFRSACKKNFGASNFNDAKLTVNDTKVTLFYSTCVYERKKYSKNKKEKKNGGDISFTQFM